MKAFHCVAAAMLAFGSTGVPVSLRTSAAGQGRATIGDLPADQHFLGVRAQFADSVVVLIINGMPHPMELSYDNGSKRIRVGTIAGHDTSRVVVREVTTDSVVVWAETEDPPHHLSRKFAMHSTVLQQWHVGL